jgi:hypothetical protein
MHFPIIGFRRFHCTNNCAGGCHCQYVFLLDYLKPFISPTGGIPCTNICSRVLSTLSLFVWIRFFRRRLISIFNLSTGFQTEELRGWIHLCILQGAPKPDTVIKTVRLTAHVNNTIHFQDSLGVSKKKSWEDTFSGYREIGRILDYRYLRDSLAPIFFVLEFNHSVTLPSFVWIRFFRRRLISIFNLSTGFQKEELRGCISGYREITSYL